MCKKQLTAINILLSIAIAISLFNEGLALKCYACEDVLDEKSKCWTNPGEDELFDCGNEVILEPYSQNANSTEATLTRTNTKVSKCAKVVFTNIKNVSAVHRACVYMKSILYTDTCDAFKKNTHIKEISFCEECTEDGCNSSSTLTLGFMTFLVPISIVMLLTH